MAIKVKICGVKTLSDLEMVLDAGADAVGLNLVPQSRRFLADLNQAREMMRMVKDAGRLGIGVFAKQALESVLDTAASIGLDGIQLHGDESSEFVAQIKARSGGTVWKAFRVASAEDLRPAQAEVWACDAMLLDSRAPSGELGGTGAAFDWSILEGFALSTKQDLVLAGGLDPENVAEAVSRVAPDWVDVASGVESTEGGKDPDKIRRFIRNARSKA